MKKIILISAILLASCTNTGTTQHSVQNTHNKDKSHWDYQGENGPLNWAKITPEYNACSGKNQSPINLTGFIESKLKPIKFHYKKGGNSIINNGHTIQVNYNKGSYINVDGIKFNLAQFHFHAPSENNINGKSYPLEAHLVHIDKNGNLAVVAVMFKEGRENKALAKAWSKMPQHAGDKHSFEYFVNVNKILPRNHAYYRFNGSLTTPPCTEGVRWLVMKNPITASKAQIKEFEHILHHPNNRPLQPVNARVIMK